MSLPNREPDMAVLVLAAALATLLLALYTGYSALRRSDSREPPLLPPEVPLIGHLLGLWTHGLPYYAKVALRTSAPIFTIDCFVRRVYIVRSAALVAAVQKNRKDIGLDPVLTFMLNRLGGIAGPGLRLLQDTRGGGGGLNHLLHHTAARILLGPGLKKLSRTMLQKFETLLDQTIDRQREPFDLYVWCRNTITIASTEAMWGSKSPFRSDVVKESLWSFESDPMSLLPGFVPSIFARKAYQAREAVVISMLDFARSGGYEESDISEFATICRNTQLENGMSEQDVARLHTVITLGSISNTAAATFWTLFDIYSRPQLLEDVRHEISNNAVAIDPETGTRSLDVGAMRESCPLLLAVFHETLRVHAVSIPTRYLYEDVLLDDKYLLRAGSILQLYGPTISSVRQDWMNQLEEFDPLRGLAGDSSNSRTSDATKILRNSFLSFGFAPHLCPGRQLATAEIMSVVAMLVMRVNLVPAKEYWWHPKLNFAALLASITPPAEAYNVQMEPREEVQGVEWAFTVNGQKHRFDLISG